jgi:hypothetical protein
MSFAAGRHITGLPEHTPKPQRTAWAVGSHLAEVTGATGKTYTERGE